MTDVHPLDALRAHPAIRLADFVADYTGVKRNLIQLTEFLSLAGGRMGCPLHLDVRSDHLGADLHLANRILDLSGRAAVRIHSPRQVHQLERQGLARPHVLLVQGRGTELFRAITVGAAFAGCWAGEPSVWRIDDRAGGEPAAPTALCLMTPEEHRDLRGFGPAFATGRTDGAADEAGANLSSFIKRLPERPSFPCPWRDRYLDLLSPERVLVLERVLRVFAAARIVLSEAPGPHAVSIEDYRASRALLCNLPLTQAERALPPTAAVTAEAIYRRSQDPKHQVSLPDRSREGTGWFTREDAREWTGLAYNTVKKHLRYMEEDGLVVSTVAETNRERGRKIHFRFAAGRSPPFGLGNPFEVLPDLPEGVTSE
jgi:hypothetical protein